jgi:opacity protein-like surface antigen
MKSSLGIIVLLALFGFAQTAGAQEGSQWSPPRMELYAGYDFLHTNVNSQSGGVYSHETYKLNGGGGQLIYNLNDRFGLVSELAGYALISGHIQPAAMSYLAGPRLTLRRGRVTPFVHTLFGGVFSKDGINNTGYTSVFGMAIGGGADVRVNRHVAVRPLQAEYFLMKFPDGANNRQNGFRYSTGVVFRLGR